jgi:single-stranded-DNA-specific exonuclease
MAAGSKSRRKAAQSRWRIAEPVDAARAKAVEQFVSTLKLTPVCARILTRRDILEVPQAEAYMSRRMDLLHDPMRLPDMDKAVQRIAEAVEKNQKIILFGDYDVDGITATALLDRFFSVLKKATRRTFQVISRVPDRKHGYGLTPQAVSSILEQKPNLLITLDNGISAHDSLDALAAAGTDCIVVDHHHLNAGLPNALAVVNPKRHDSTYPFNELCGAGISFKLAWALAVHFSQNKKVSPEFRTFLLDAIALAGTGTLADIVPLVDENRVLAHQGLLALSRTHMPGLRALIEKSNIEGVPRTSDVGFRIGPRINAAGRCGDANEALELLLTENVERAAELAAKLEDYNVERQGIETKILDEARQQALEAMKDAACRALVLDSADWHHGVIGIVASRIVEEFYRPTFMLSIDKETQIARGSGRSIRGLHLSEALAQQKEFLLTFGGHAAAAGLSINAASIETFRSGLQSTAAKLLKDEDLVPILHIDERVTLDQVNQKLCHDFEMFEPCGAGNPRPMLAVCNLKLSTPPSLFGKAENHLSFFAKEGSTARRVVGFNCAEHFNRICDATQSGGIDVAFRPQVNSFRGNTSIEMHMDAFRPSEPPVII